MNFVFDLQRFNTLAIAAGETHTLDGLTYTAIDGKAQLNLDSDGKVSGIASGKIEAVVTDAETSATITFDASDGAFNFTAVAEDDSLNVGYNDVKIHYTGGELTYTANSIEIPAGEVSVVGSGTIPINATINFPAAATATFADGVVSANLKDVSGEVSIAGTTFGTLSVDGEISFNQTTREVNFAKGATIDVNMKFLDNFDISLTALDNVGGIFAFNNSPMGIKFTPNSGDGALGIVISEDGTTKFGGEINCRAGSFTFGLSGGLSLESGTVLDVKINGMTATLTAKGDSPAEIGLSDGKFVLTPGTNSSLEISAGFIAITGDITLTQGSIAFDPSTKEISLVKDTELQINFGNDYVVTMKTTKDAGGAISIGENGITFTPNEDDGGLELTVTRDGETRTASLDVTGSVTYKLDGSISLAQGTVVKNVFEDGNILTITANTAASGSIVFTPDTGITITPAEPTALNVLFTGGGGEVEVFNITSIDGSINYKGGIVTASKDTEVLFTNYYMENEMKLSTEGGSSSLEITEDSTSYIANEGATFTLDYQDGTTLKITEGKFIDDYEHAIITAGSTFETNDDEDYFYLQTAGNYNLNGMNVTTTVANVPVILAEDSIILNDLTYKPLDDDVTLTIGTNSITCAGGKANVSMGLLGAAFDFDATKGSFTFDSSNNTFAIKKGTVISLAQNNSELQVTALEDTSATVRTDDEGIIYCDWADTTSSTLSLVRDGKTVIALPFTMTGTTSYSPSTGTLALVYDEANQTNSSATIGLANYKINLTTPNKTFIVGLEPSADGKLTISYPREEYSTMNLAILRGNDAIFGGALTVDGSVVLDPTNHTLTLKDGTSTEMTFGDNYTLKATANGDATSAFAIVDEGLVITPNTGDGTLQLEIGNGSASMKAELEVLSGSFTLKDGGALTVAKDTEMQLTFSDNYSVKFKTTDAAGGTLSLGKDGINFTPGSDDGKLELTVTRDGESRTASLDVTGSVIYKLDGSITLTEGTVVKNVFEDGNELTITANTDASGSIIFNPGGGLTVIPSTADALTVALTTDDLEVAKFSSITGSVTYSGGIVTASDGTQANLIIYGNDEWASHLSVDGGTASLEFTAEKTVYTANDNATFVLKYDDNGATLQIQNGSFSDIYATEDSDAIELISVGSTFKCNDEEFVFTLESAGDYTLNGMNVTTTADNVEVQLVNDDTIIVNGISYTPLDEDVTLTIDGDVATVEGGKVSLQMDGFSKVAGFDTTDGSISYDSSAGKFTIAQGTKSYFGNGAFPDQFVAQSDFDITVTKNSDGTFTLSSDDSAALAIERNGKVAMQTTVTLDGSIVVDPSKNQITLPKDTLISLTPDGGKTLLEIKALDEAGGKLSFVDNGIRFAPNKNDGALEFNFASSNRKAQLDVTGAFIYKGLGALELENGTEATFTWEDDGTTLKLTSSGSTGSIGLDPELGIKITSDDENLDMTFTTATGYTTEVSDIKGTIYYKEGVVSFAENSQITATTTLGGQPILTTLETIDGTGHISFNTTNGVIYAADTGALKITWTNEEGLESTFTVNSGSVQIGHNLFKITEGTDLATDLKDFVPALYFTTSEAGTYTINGQKIKTSAEGLDLTATDDYMSFETSDDKVEYDGMTFAGSGNVSLKPDIVVLGAGVEATGFDEGNTFMLAEAGNVTADAKTFELFELQNRLKEDIPLNVSVEGATDGFIFSRTITRESEDYFDDPDYDNVGKIFTEKFIVHGDETYRTRTSPIGLEEVIGISKNSTTEGGATLGDEVSPSRYDLITDTNGEFTIGENTYKIADDTEVGVILTARFNGDLAYASAVKDLNGTISGNFSDGGFAVNGNDSLNVYNDTDISIIGSGKNYEILGLDTNASLRVSAAGTYDVNGTEIVARADDIIIGTEDGKAQLYTPVALADFMLHKTEAGYPQMASLAFHPDEENPDAPTNYYLAEPWTTTSTDDLQLSAIHYSPENPTGKWVILVHGYGKTGAAMNAFAEPYLAQGMDVLIIDQRTAGDSEGDWLTMGVAEANDLAIWTQEIAKTNANAQITLHGVSMGAATVMLSAALPETTNVSAIIEDCGYGNIADVFAALMYAYGSSLGVSGGDFYELFDEVAKVAKTLDGGYDVSKAAPIDSIAAVTVPSLFIHGAADYVIPSTNADALYKASGASNKTKLIIEGAGHAKSVELDADAYFKAVKKLIASSTTEIGALIDSDADNKLLRGTIYNDTISNSGDDVTINGGKGDDLISLSGSSALINYTEGEGNDTIVGFDETATLSIGDSTYSTQVSGNDLIITVGESKITLVDAANLSDPNIESTNEAANLIEILLKRTALGYPIASGVLLNPEELIGEEPTNYSAKEEWTITSADNLELYGVHYAPENSNDKWVVLVHGYGLKHESMYPFTYFYLANDYNVLMIDQRAAGKSEGTWLTMGAAESQDVALWTQEIARRNSNAKITLHGVSMGSATAMLAASREDAVNVTSLIEDCGYTDTIKLFYVLNEVLKEFGIGAEPEVVAALDSVGYGMMGYYLHDASPINSISSAKMPTLFIHGDDDGVVPVSMVSELYDASGAEVKEKFIVKGAGHAQSGLNDLVGYSNAVFRFIAEANGEGWVTTNTTDGISLRGTKYDDTITNSGDDVTINGGKGNDSFNSTGDDVQFDYTKGDGNDSIYGFNSTSTLSISGADFTAQKSGDDIIVTVNEENITLVDAASLSSPLNIINQNGVTSNLIINSTNNTLVTGTDEDDHIINSGTTVTIQGYAGDDYIENSVDSSLTAASLGNYIDAGEDNDTIYNYHTYNPTLIGGEGNDSILVSRGHLTYVDGGEGNDTIIGKKDSGGWDMGGYATVLGGDGDDYINTGYSNSASIDGGAGNDTIYATGNRITINGGAGNNLVKVSPSSLDADNECAYIIFNGDTTVQGFKTGFGNGSDTVYIPGNPAAVDFKSGVLTFYDDNNSLTLSDVHKTAKVNLFHEKRDVLNKGVFIADNEWYKVAEADLTVNAGEEVYFVGPSATKNHGVDFSGISSALNLTIDTAYVDSEDYVPGTTTWINGVYSIKGGAGLTTITGSKNSDTIIGGSGETTINGKGGDDLISLSSGAALIEYTVGDGNDSIVGFKANSTLSISGSKYTRERNGDDLILTVGDDKITLFGASSTNVIGQRDIPVEELKSIYGDKLTVVSGSVELDDEGAAVAVYEEDSAVDVIGGAGNDTLIALGSAPITFDMSAGGADKLALVTTNQNVTIEGYDAAQGGGIATGNPNIASMVEEIMAGKDTRFGNGKVSLKTSEETQSVFTLAENASPKGSAIINFFDANNRILPVGFTNELGGTVDVSKSSNNYLLIGNYFGEKSGGSTLFGGSGNDTLLGGAGDLLDGEGGNNEIYLSGGGARIGLDNGGRTAVHNFQTGFDSDGDALYSKGDIAARIRFDGENITASIDGGAQVTLEYVASDADFAELLMHDGEDLTKIAVAKPGGTIKSEEAQVYLGRGNEGVDFSGMTDDLLVNLSDEPVVTGSEQKQFFGINQVIASDGNSTLIGTSGNETLTAGNGNTSIWGGAGYDSLIGKGGSTNKTGSTTFFFEPGDGRDIIKDFNFLTSENINDGTSDAIDIGENVIKDASISRGKVFVDFEDGSRLVIRDAVGKDFRIGDLVAKVDTNISYDGLANCYVAAGGSSLTVDSTVESAEIWLDNSHDTLFFGNIKTLDASAVKGNTSLVGNEFNNTIIGGQGDSSLWGGSSTSNDLLIGGAGKNTFFYLQGDGKDTVQNVNDGDEIILDNINLDQIVDANISDSAVTVNFNDGGSLTINGTADVTYQLNDGSRYSANHTTKEWDSK